ncbi:MAG: GNAT family N-acetyltransferase [Acidobacteria bacterium]|nr:GNAT family N-acetyltransferase [Acidobacteriota bacterium]
MFRIIAEGMEYREHVLLKDGQGVFLRPATPEDVPLVKEFMKGLSQESLRMRFMASVSEVPEQIIVDMCSTDLTDRGCLLALTGEGDEQHVVGLGNYVGLGNGKTAEVAFLVADEYQGRGISTTILERLAGLAAAQGYVEFEAEVLFENRAMLNVFKSSGFEVHQGAQGGVMHVEFPVRGATALRERSELRERIAVANSLAPLLRPRVIAVVGASRSPSSIGNMIFRHILHAGFPGTVYPVNPEAESVHGVRAYPSIADLPEPVDLAVVSVPAEAVLDVAEHAVKAGTKGLLVVSSGFAEVGPEGVERQEKLLDLVRAHGLRLIGPNCLGLMNTDPEVHVNASLAPELAPLGRVGFFSHSAALGLVILEFAAERGLGFSTFVSAGNRADVSGNDLLQYWEEDPNTDMALLYLETFGNPRRFTRIARRFAHRKPILAVKGARSAAAQSVTRIEGRQTFGGAALVDALFRQAGVIRAETLDEMFDVAVVLTHQPLPRGERVAIVSNSRGVATLFADACDANGLVLAGPGIIDLGAMTDADQYEHAVRDTLADDEVDSLLVSFACVGDCTGQPIVAAIRRGVDAAEAKTGVPKPVLLCLMGAAGAVEVEASADAGEAPRRVFPSFLFPESAPRALAKVVAYARFRRQKPGTVRWFEDADAASARELVRALLETRGAGEDGLVWAGDDTARSILACFGIGVEETARDTGVKTGEALDIGIRSDRHFGPLIEIRCQGTPPLVRITPLTDLDIAEVVSGVECADDPAIEELLARVSQMIEELPWLSSMSSWLIPGEEGGPKLHGVRIALRPISGQRPNMAGVAAGGQHAGS